ncbi:MAG: hypothetical protein N2Z23_00155 [Pyrinomonadaceae bacterium]|nr:hypothetical protein [Pyrinomonadaceae bacterium]MCX7638845.1 hypothetical protein [Pyrinomonadaceae bacterium]MDW8305019.1 hypothetical protein [Acidobacteriota bacterium]
MMKRKLLSTFWTVALVLNGFLILTFETLSQELAIYRGYRTGYSDGYTAGYTDATKALSKDYERHQAYKQADRNYKPEIGSIEDYKDGYRQGFEKGYDDGYARLPFNSEVPENLTKRTSIKVGLKDETTKADSKNDVIVIPADTELIIELQQEVSTEKNQEGDKFIAKVLSPSQLQGALIEGRINKIQKPGRIKRRAEMLLSFDIIRLNDTRWANYNAMVIEVLPLKGDNVKRVNNEGTVEGKSSVKEDAIKVGASASVGAVTGGVIGGPVGVAVGAGVGAAFGLGTIFVEKGKHIKLAKGQQLRIRTAYETRIR